MTANYRNNHHITPEEIKALRQAQTICFDYGKNLSSGNVSQMRAILKTTVKAFGENHTIEKDVEIPTDATFKIYALDAWNQTYDEYLTIDNCYQNIGRYSFSLSTLDAFVELLRPDDTVELEWTRQPAYSGHLFVDWHNDPKNPYSNYYMENAYTCQLHAIIHRNDKMKYRLLLDEQTGPNNTASMIRGVYIRHPQPAEV